MPKTYVFDIDGTICVQTKGGPEYENPEPIHDMIAKIALLKSQGNTIIFHTARGMNTYKDARICDVMYRPWTELWLKRHCVPYDDLIFGKPPADYYVDDKAVHPYEL